MSTASATMTEDATPSTNEVNADYDEVIRLAQRGMDIAHQILTGHQRVDGLCSCGGIWPCSRAESIGRTGADWENIATALTGPTVVIRFGQDEPVTGPAQRRGWFRRRREACRKT